MIWCNYVMQCCCIVMICGLFDYFFFFMFSSWDPNSSEINCHCIYTFFSWLALLFIVHNIAFRDMNTWRAFESMHLVFVEVGRSKVSAESYKAHTSKLIDLEVWFVKISCLVTDLLKWYWLVFRVPVLCWQQRVIALGFCECIL